jgi:hypothetical protein
MTPFDEALAISRGESRMLPTLDHLHALVDEILRVKMLNGTLTRSLEMLAKLHKEDMNARDAWADTQEAAQAQKVSAR